MAKSKTGTFILTERIDLTDGSTGTNTIDLGSYVSVGDRLGVAVEKIDFTIQGKLLSTGAVDSLQEVFTTDAQIDMQLFDLTQSALQPNDNRSLVASGSFLFDEGNNVVTQFSDVYPDVFGKLDEARIVVNDNMVLVAGAILGAFAATHGVYVTVRIHARIVKLDTKDWMAIAIQSTAADN